MEEREFFFCSFFASALCDVAMPATRTFIRR